MALAMSLESLAERVAQTGLEVASLKADARRESVRAIRLVEAHLVFALTSDRLRGAPNIGPKGTAYRAYRLGTRRHHEELPASGREVLVLTVRGAIAVAHVQDGKPTERPALDDELIVEDLEVLCEVLRAALERHLSLAGERAVVLRAARQLALRLTAALEAK